MRILFVVGKFPDLTFILRTVQALAARGHQVTVAARQRGNWTPFQDQLPLPPMLVAKYLLPESGFSDPRRVFALATGLPSAIGQSPSLALDLIQRLRRDPRTRKRPLSHFIRYLPFVGLRPDVIQFDFAMTAYVYPMLSELLGAPTVVSCRGADVHMLEQREPDEHERRMTTLQKATAIHCVSEEMATQVTRITGRTRGIWVNRPAIPVNQIVPRQQYIANAVPSIVAVGRLTWKKGFDYLLAALARLKQAGIAFRAQIIGDGELHAVLRFSIGDLNLADVVQLTGALPPSEVLKRVRDADIFVLSSHEEGISNAVLEAMASGVPIVTTTAGGMGEAVRDGIEGFVVPVRDIGALTDRIERLIADAPRREQMGRAARLRVEAEFTLERQATVFGQMYQSIIGQPQA